MIWKSIHIEGVIDQKFLIAFSQHCYQQLSDISGTEFTAGQLSDLEQAACDLIDSLPQAYQDSFTVLDYGFYLHNRSMDQGVEDIWQEVIQAADAISPYYLLLGRVPGREGAVKVELKMPGSSFFSCFDEQTKNYFESVNSVTGIEYISDLVNEMVFTMGKLAYEIKKWEACCDPNLKSETCALCPDNISEFRAFLENNGFISAPVSSLSYSENDHQNGVVHALYDISCTLPDGSPLDINHDVEAYLNSIATKVEGIEGNIAHYDPANLNCTDVLEWVNGIPSVALQGNPNTRTKSKKSKSSQDRFLLKMDVITTEDAGGNVEVHMRSSEDLGDLPECEVGRIFLVEIEETNTNLNMDTVQHHIIDFFELLLLDSVNHYTPDVVIDNSVSIDDLEELDGICILGYQASVIFDYVKNNFHPHHERFVSWVVDEASIERGDSKRKVVSVVSMKRTEEEWSRVVSKHGRNKTAAFVAFHGIGHTAGQALSHATKHANRGFMSYGSYVERDLGSDDPSYSKSMEELIFFARSAWPEESSDNDKVSDYIKKRFIK